MIIYKELQYYMELGNKLMQPKYSTEIMAVIIGLKFNVQKHNV